MDQYTHTCKFMYIYIIVCIHLTDKIFSFLSQDEVEKMRQEEGKLLSFFTVLHYIICLNVIKVNETIYIYVFIEKKIATLTRDELKSWAQLDENEGLEDLDLTMDNQDNGRPK